MARRALLALLVLAAAACARDPSPDTVIIVVRHGEKSTSDPRDPDLSEAGQARASALAQALAGAPVGAIYATQFRRTHQTAEPLARNLGLTIQSRPIDIDHPTGYAPDLAKHLRTLSGQTVLVVGHSNTVPDIVAALTGKAVPPIADTEYTRLYVITLPATGGPARMVAARY
jgi:broad specificity phosphatase PhoE